MTIKYKFDVTKNYHSCLFFSSSSLFFFCFYSNRVKASATIFSLRPFFLRNIYFSFLGIFSIFSPPRKSTAIPIFFYYSSILFKSSFRLACEFPIWVIILFINNIDLYQQNCLFFILLSFAYHFKIFKMDNTLQKCEQLKEQGNKELK